MTDDTPMCTQVYIQFQQWQQIFTPTLYFPKHTFTSAHSSVPMVSSCSSLLAYTPSLVRYPITTKGMGTGAGFLQNRSPERHSTHESPLNFDLTLGTKRATTVVKACIVSQKEMSHRYSRGLKWRTIWSCFYRNVSCKEAGHCIERVTAQSSKFEQVGEVAALHSNHLRQVPLYWTRH